MVGLQSICDHLSIQLVPKILSSIDLLRFIRYSQKQPHLDDTSQNKRLFFKLHKIVTKFCQLFYVLSAHLQKMRNLQTHFAKRQAFAKQFCLMIPQNIRNGAFAKRIVRPVAILCQFAKSWLFCDVPSPNVVLFMNIPVQFMLSNYKLNG